TSVAVDFISISVEPGQDLVVTLPSGVTERRTITDVDADVITVGTPFSAVPVSQSVWAVDSTAMPLARYRVLSVKERNDERSIGYQVSAIVHVPGKYGYADTGEPIETTPIPDVPGPLVPTPTGLTI